MEYEFYNDLMLKFLNHNFSVLRVKSDGRFKRAIIFDNNTFFISHPEALQILKIKLIDLLTKIFSCDEKISRVVLNNFLPLS
mgnify:CR=1 FL=1